MSCAVPMVLDFIKGGNVQSGSQPGFGHALRLSYHTMDHHRLSWDETTNSLHYTYQFTNQVEKPTTSLFMAIMDELTTDALFAFKLPSAPGASIHMDMQVVAENLKALKRKKINEMEVMSTVIKSGKNISYSRCEFYYRMTVDGESKKSLLAWGTHVKFMPTGSYVLDFVFNNRWAWNLYSSYVGSSLPVYYDEKNLWKEVMRPFLNFQGIGRATFKFNKLHTNPFGALHGGCYALLVEMVGQSLAKNKLHSSVSIGSEPDEALLLETLEIDYISASRQGEVTIVAELVVWDAESVRIRVTVSRSDGQVASEARLRWSVTKDDKPQTNPETKGDTENVKGEL